MAIFKIAALAAKPTPRYLVSDTNRAEAGYTANRLATIVNRNGFAATIEGQAFWADVCSRLQQIKDTGEAQ